MNLDFQEITITRRLYRNGDSNYLLNGKTCRLADVQLLLAEAGVGQRSYSVIGQGMIDHILTSSPEERKVFFDDATGVRGLQIKRKSSLNKLKKASQNLTEVDMLLQEIEPRLKSLKRQVNRLEKRSIVEEELHTKQNEYYASAWWQLQGEYSAAKSRISPIDTKIKTLRTEQKKREQALADLEKTLASTKTERIKGGAEQQQYREAQRTLSKTRQSLFEAQRDLELAKVRSQSNWSPLPLHEIIKELDEILKLDESKITQALKLIKLLKTRLTKPQPEDFKPDPTLLNRIAEAKSEITKAESNLKAAETAIDKAEEVKDESQTEVFAESRKLRSLQNEIHNLEQQENQHKIDLARVETRIESIKREMHEELSNRFQAITATRPQTFIPNQEAHRSKILHLKHQLELIGGIEPEIITEYEETKERFEFLNTQHQDIKQAITATEKIIDELDEQIRSQSEKAFKKINEEFKKYFQILFGGGSCSLLKVKNEPIEENRVDFDRAIDALVSEAQTESEPEEKSIADRVKKRQDAITGIEIQATPPGKKLKSLNALSGGERALTSIALLSAVMATNPSPFVVLDEVDAALDEQNTMRFANILEELRRLTQFIVISHNRATMERADLLYGVTMTDNGISSLLSVNISDIEKHGTTRR